MRQIETRAELEQVASGSVLRCGNGEIAEISNDYRGEEFVQFCGDELWYDRKDVPLPAWVLWEPLDAIEVRR
jgi:hypothetical protein